MVFICAEILSPHPMLPSYIFPWEIPLWLSQVYSKPSSNLLLWYWWGCITPTEPLFKQIPGLHYSYFCFPALLLRKRLLLCVQPCRCLAPPLGQLQLALQGESCLCSGFYFHVGERNQSRMFRYIDCSLSIVTLICLKSRRKESFHSVHSYHEKLPNSS